MIDETTIRAALEAPLGLLTGESRGSFSGIPVSRAAEAFVPHGPHIRTYMVREARKELYRSIRRISGMFGVLVHVPIQDGLIAAESIASQIPPLYRPNEVDNALFDGSITIREISLMSPYRGIDEAKDGAPQWLVVPIQIDWRIDTTH